MNKSLLSIFFLIIVSVAYSQSLLDKKVNLEQGTGTVEEILLDIGTKAGFSFTYSNLIDSKRTITVSRGPKTVRAYLDEIFSRGSVEYIITQDKVILKPRLEETSSARKTYSIHGHVKDSVTGEVLIGASVVIKELAAGVSTNVYGFYSIAAPPGHYKLTVSFVGFRSWSQEIN